VGLATLERRLTAAEAGLGTVVPIPPTPLALAEAVGFEPDGWQRDVLASDADQVILRCARQSGKSTVSGLVALDAALQGRLALCVSPTERQSSELLRRVKAFLRSLPTAPPLVSETSTSLELSGGGRVLALPGRDDSTVRGYSDVAVLIEDEGARVSDDLHNAVKPMLAISKGRILLLSTPWGKRGHYWDTWENGGAGWFRVTVRAQDCPRIDPAWLEREKASIPPNVYASEYDVEFVDNELSVFAADEVMRALDDGIRPLFPVAA
jgi:hypothetical protein